ncbi:HD domain-containing protein [Halanaerocella petrolearia]
MNKNKFLALEEWFDNYVNNFSLTDPTEQENIDLKYKHTYKVCEMIERIAKELVVEEGLYIAKTIALFHDVGRFKQYNQYKTFSDAESEDHAELGIKILLDNNVLADLEELIVQLVLTAISYHNKATLPENESEEPLFYSKLIRDADKLDIWRVVLKDYNKESRNKTVGLGLEDNDKISDYVYHQIMKEDVVEYERLQTLNDFKLIQMGWVYDINFGPSFEVIKERNYIDRLFETLPKSKRANQVYAKIKSYLIEQIN